MVFFFPFLCAPSDLGPRNEFQRERGSENGRIPDDTMRRRRKSEEFFKSMTSEKPPSVLS